ncbi:MAG: helix-turn-helix domain-containing protein [Flavobacteriaceae bacterium]|nr:helix-turn-helix domain-containing protein [Flavobacteriaceae bacterium]
MDKNDLWFLKPILTFKEACSYCGMSTSKMYKHTSGREIPFYKPEGKKIYFLREELDKWLLRNRVPTNEELERAATKTIL